MDYFVARCRSFAGVRVDEHDDTDGVVTKGMVINDARAMFHVVFFSVGERKVAERETPYLFYYVLRLPV